MYSRGAGGSLSSTLHLSADTLETAPCVHKKTSLGGRGGRLLTAAGWKPAGRPPLLKRCCLRESSLGAQGSFWPLLSGAAGRRVCPGASVRPGPRCGV